VVDKARTATARAEARHEQVARQPLPVRRTSAVVEKHTEVVLPPSERPTSTVIAVRSTLLASSLQAVREASLLDAYTRALPSRYHEEVLHTLSPVWLPLATAMAHYQAMDSLGLSEEDVLRIGRNVGGRLHGTFLGTLIRGVREVGFTPWSIAGKLDRVWSRVFEGGAVSVTKLGPKEARMSMRGLPLLEYAYFRVGLRGVLSSSIETFTQKCYVRESGPRPGPHAIDFVLSWV